jgi:hypothetical protein
MAGIRPATADKKSTAPATISSSIMNVGRIAIALASCRRDAIYHAAK